MIHVWTWLVALVPCPQGPDAAGGKATEQLRMEPTGWKPTLRAPAAHPAFRPAESFGFPGLLAHAFLC